MIVDENVRQRRPQLDAFFAGHEHSYTCSALPRLYSGARLLTINPELLPRLGGMYHRPQILRLDLPWSIGRASAV
ncbi:hypothetical protein, partial [Streptomyces sp. P9(2023)]|uniref:hypothetical protein n=1 Tax=Streptomyces sp. P9(2023) TaxID=3064394 RepID=UPI0028F40197